MAPPPWHSGSSLLTIIQQNFGCLAGQLVRGTKMKSTELFVKRPCCWLPGPDNILDYCWEPGILDMHFNANLRFKIWLRQQQPGFKPSTSFCEAASPASLSYEPLGLVGLSHCSRVLASANVIDFKICRESSWNQTFNLVFPRQYPSLMSHWDC